MSAAAPTGGHRRPAIAETDCRLLLATVLLALLGWVPTAAEAQPAQKPAAAAPRPATPPNPATAAAFDATRAIWETLPLDRRTAIQEALVWSGDYAGALDGTFGRMTFDAVAAFLARRKLGPETVGGDVAGKALAELMTTKKTAVGWQMVADATTGIRIGLPTRLIGPARKTDTGSRWTSKDGRIDIAAHRIAGTDLAVLYDTVRADRPGRRITYSVLRPDWFVVADEVDGRHGYARFVRGGTELRGFTFVIDVGLGPDLDRVVVATADTFEPFPGTAALQTATPTTPAGPAAPPRTAEATPPAVPTASLASALRIAPGRAIVASAAIADCRSLTVGGRPARTAPIPSNPRLSFLAFDGGPATTVKITTTAAVDGPLMAVAAGEDGRPVVVAGRGAAGAARLPLQKGGAGAVVADLSGSVIGLVAGRPNEARLIAGLVPEATYPMVAAAEVAAALKAEGLAVEERTTDPSAPRSVAGDAVRALAPAILPVTCGR
jgi:hypothetical protein